MGQSSSSQSYQTQATKQIFILAGQSNMSGRGGVDHNRWDGVVPPQCSADPSQIFRLNAHLNWEVAREPLHYDIDTKKTCGVGPGMSFANAIKARVVGTVGLVPCAIGGTAIKKWAKGTQNYEKMVSRARAAAQISGGEIKALLWYQGETDTKTEHDANSYKANMVNLIRNVRADLQLPSLPIIQVAIASGEGRYVEKVREAQKGMKIANVVCVDAKGLQLKEDRLHLTTEAQVQLGAMLAHAYLSNFITPPTTASYASI